MQIGPMRLISYSDNAEDVLLMRAFYDRPGGTFVDVGAGSPMVGSVIKNLSDLLDWRGVHIEPQVELAEALRVAYPADTVVCTAIGRRAGERTLYVVERVSGLTTLHEPFARNHAALGQPVRRIPAEVQTLDEVLTMVGVPERFELLKIDVEGLEDEVLAGTSLERWRPSVILIEVTEPMTPRVVATPWHDRMASAGYQLALFDGLNRFYVTREDEELHQRLTVPANVFDRYIPYHWYQRIPEGSRPDIAYEPWNDVDQPVRAEPAAVQPAS